MAKKKAVSITEGAWGILPDQPDSEDCNIYVLADERTCILIDAGFEESLAETIAAMESIGYSLSSVDGILVTHAHIDHVGALSEIQSKTGCWIAASEKTRHALRHVDHPLILAQPHNRVFKPVEAERTLAEGQVVCFGKFEIEVYETPGHTIDSLCFFEKKNGLLFSGDTVLCDGGIGFVVNPSGDLAAEQASIRRLSRLPVKALLPGHRRIETQQANAQIKESLAFSMQAPADHGSQYYKEKMSFNSFYRNV
ncbi:MAG: MBL fold metallo-hydrolase [Candidatus Ranarchaeia archaeon]